MKFRIFLLCLCAIVQTQGGFSQKLNYETPLLIPKPQKEIYSNMFLRLPLVITMSNDMDINAKNILKKALFESLNIEVSYGSNENSLIRFFIDKQLADEAYRIRIDTAHIDIYAYSSAGSLWAIQTLHQMIKFVSLTSVGQIKQLPVTDIEDSPRYGWRGFHLDVARHFLTKEYLLKTIERLSFYKIKV